jgi:IS1 family transposase
VGAGAAEKTSGELVIEADELWSFIGAKKQVGWGWVALDARTRQVAAMVVGDRDEFTARCLWEALPPGYQKRAVVATDLLPLYRAAIPEDRHAPAGKGAGLTAHVERVFAPCGSGTPGSSAKRCRSPERWRTTSAPSGTSSDNFVRQYNLCRA